ncbi:MAG: hypothetical protein JW741_18290 [Sedimentisphaerales bacterium]|nr:hypothetical protein [Sedimentisphaerales bacterium]
MARIKKQTGAGSEVVTLDRGSLREHFVTLTPTAGESHESLFERAGATTHALGGEIVSAEVLGVAAGDRKDLDRLVRGLDGGAVPLGWVENTRTDDFYGIHLWLVTGVEVQRLEWNGRCVGTVLEDEDVRYCRLVGLLPTDAMSPRGEQAAEILQQMEALLEKAQMAFSDVLRTWFYNNAILDWYGGFNKVRTAFFKEKGVFDGLLPASTGVGGRNAGNAALTAGLIAVRAKSADVQAFETPSPLQSPAPEYGSSFSRAVELDTPDHRRLYVSGTASIDEQGNTVFLDDPAAQLRKTMEVVQAILQARQMDWEDVVRALAYFKHHENAPLFEARLRENRLPRFPVVIVENDICRDDLLFEIEVDAIKAK